VHFILLHLELQGLLITQINETDTIAEWLYWR